MTGPERIRLLAVNVESMVEESKEWQAGVGYEMNCEVLGPSRPAADRVWTTQRSVAPADMPSQGYNDSSGFVHRSRRR